MQGFHSFLPHFSVFCYFLKSFRFQPAIKGPWPKNWTRDKKSLLQNIPGCKISSKYPWLQNILVTKHPGCKTFLAAKHHWLQNIHVCKTSWQQNIPGCITSMAAKHPGCKISFLLNILSEISFLKYPGCKTSLAAEHPWL